MIQDGDRTVKWSLVYGEAGTEGTDFTPNFSLNCGISLLAVCLETVKSLENQTSNLWKIIE